MAVAAAEGHVEQQILVRFIASARIPAELKVAADQMVRTCASSLVIACKHVMTLSQPGRSSADRRSFVMQTLDIPLNFERIYLKHHYFSNRALQRCVRDDPLHAEPLQQRL